MHATKGAVRCRRRVERGIYLQTRLRYVIIRSCRERVGAIASLVALKRRAWVAIVVVAILATACGKERPSNAGTTTPPGITEARTPFALSARGTVVRFIRLGQAGRFDAACVTLDLRRSEGRDLYGDLRDTALASLSSDAASPAARKRDLDRKRAMATNCRGVLTLIFEELGPKADQLAARAAHTPVYWVGPIRTNVLLGNDEAWTLTSSARSWRISTTNALVDALQ
jgi:hypothetical protein